MAAVADDLRARGRRPYVMSRRVVFVHTGGAFGTLPYARRLVP
jgi:hypothetical protein